MIFTGQIIAPIFGTELYLIAGVAQTTDQYLGLSKLAEDLDSFLHFNPTDLNNLKIKAQVSLYSLYGFDIAIDGGLFSSVGLSKSTKYLPGDLVLLFKAETQPYFIILSKAYNSTNQIGSVLDIELAETIVDKKFHEKLLSRDAQDFLLRADSPEGIIDNFLGSYYFSQTGIRFGANPFSVLLEATPLASLELSVLGGKWSQKYNSYQLEGPDRFEYIDPTEGKINHYIFQTYALNDRFDIEISDEADILDEIDDNTKEAWQTKQFEGYFINGKVFIAGTEEKDISGARDKEPALKILELIDGTFGIQASKGIYLEKTCVLTSAFVNDVLAQNKSQKDEAILHYEDPVVNSEDIAEFSFTHRPFGRFDPDNVYIYSSLEDKQGQIKTPEIQDQFIQDLPQKEKEIYLSKSFIHQLPDGSIRISDGYGSEITLAKGNIYISCPGDIFFVPGRSIIGLAGHDAIFRAPKSIDLVAIESDVRIKAQKNLELTAGRSGSGGILIESLATGDPALEAQGEDRSLGGITIKSENIINLWGKNNVHFTTENFNIETSQNYRISANDYIGVFGSYTIKSEDHLIKFGRNSYLSGSLVVKENATIFERTFCLKDLIAERVITLKNPSYPDDIDLPDEQQRRLLLSIEEDTFNDFAESSASAISSFDDNYNNEISRWNDYLAEYRETYESDLLTFTYRTPQQYKSENFSLISPRWQKFVSGGNSFVTESISYKGVDVGPYPGPDVEQAEGSLIDIDPSTLIINPQTLDIDLDFNQTDKSVKIKKRKLTDLIIFKGA